MPLEIERKYLGVDMERLRRILEESGAVCHGIHWEENTVFETAPPSLLPSRRLLRLRTQAWPDGRRRHVLTLKLPSAENETFKVREEMETVVEDAAVMRGILERLGYAVRARYEKIREPWAFDGVEIDMDVLPFCSVVELEGLQDAIDRVAALTGLDKSPVSVKTYHELHQEWRRTKGLAPEASFVFGERERDAWFRRLALS
ncbi:MAG: class IV adenylate cyclase [Desulfovibrio sp.]|nr:class IV adenylate cyclase [Desulfovibrio sp.]